jgi:hypothetical protein
MNDTRLQAGAASTSTTAFPSEATTAEPSVVTVTYDKITETRATVTPTSDTGKLWPAYYNASGNIQAMNLQDVKDTFLHPAIDLLTQVHLQHNKQEHIILIQVQQFQVLLKLVVLILPFLQTLKQTQHYIQQVVLAKH